MEKKLLQRLLPTLAVIGTLVYLSRGSRGGAGGGPGGIGRVFKMMDSKATRVRDYCSSIHAWRA